MGNPFQDQLLKAGLVNKKQANKVKREKHLNRKQNKENTPSASSTKAREELEAQARRTREINRKRAEEKLQHEKKAQVKQLIEMNRVEREEWGEPYHFVEQNKINRIFVSDDMAEQLSSGQLAIVKLGESYEVVSAKAASQIASRDKEAVVVFHKG